MKDERKHPPMMNPRDAPEKRPSVMRAVLPPSPAPMSAAVWPSISGMPGPPLGPWYRKMMAMTAVISPLASAVKNGGMLQGRAGVSVSNERKCAATHVSKHFATP